MWKIVMFTWTGEKIGDDWKGFESAEDALEVYKRYSGRLFHSAEKAGDKIVAWAGPCVRPAHHAAEIVRE